MSRSKVVRVFHPSRISHLASLFPQRDSSSQKDCRPVLRLTIWVPRVLGRIWCLDHGVLHCVYAEKGDNGGDDEGAQGLPDGRRVRF